MIQAGFPFTHELHVVLGREGGEVNVALRAEARMAVSDLRFASWLRGTDPDRQLAGRYAGRDLDHLDESARRVVARDEPDRVVHLGVGDEDAVLLRVA